MPKLLVPSPQNTEQFTPESIGGVASAAATGAELGEIQRTQGASATAQGAGIGSILEQAAKDVAARNQQFFNEAQSAIEDSIYNDTMSKARVEYNQSVIDRMSKPYDDKGNPTFATLPTDIAKLGDDIKSKYGANLANPRVSAKFNQDFSTLQANSAIQAMQQSRQEMQQFTVGSMYKNITSAADAGIKAGVSGDLISRDLYYTQGVDALNAGLKNGSISPEEFEKGKESLRSKVYYESLATMNSIDPKSVQELLKTNTPEDLKINQVEYGNLIQKNLGALEALKKRDAKITKEKEQLELQQFNFNKQEAVVGIKTGKVTSSDVDDMLDRGEINHEIWSDLKLKALSAEGVTAKKSIDIRNISGDVNANRALSKYSSSQINDYYDHSVGLLSNNGQQEVTMMQKAQIATDTKAPIPRFTDEITGIVKGEKDPSKVMEAVKALDFAASENPYAVQSMDKETLGLISLIAIQSKGTNRDPARIIDTARQAVLNIDPTVKEFRNTQFSQQDKFKSSNIEETISKTIQSQTAGVIGNNKIQPDLIPMYNSLFKEAYTITGDQDATIETVKQWTSGTVGVSKVNNIEQLGPDKATAMLYPPEKLFPQYKSEEIRANLNQTVAGLLVDNTHMPAGISPDQVFIGSDATTRQNLANPSYMLYYLDQRGKKQTVLDKEGMPVHYRLDATERAKMDQAKEDVLRVQHEKALEGNDAQKQLQNRKLDDIFRKSMSSTTVFDLAQKYVGLGEIKDRGILTQTMSKMLGQAVDPSRTPWCAAFVNTMLQANGIKGSGSLAAASFLNYGTPTMTPNQGDIVVTKPLAEGTTGHVGLFAGYEYKNGQRYVKILAGNANNSVAYQSLPESVVRGYRQPPSVSELQTNETMRGVMKVNSESYTTNQFNKENPLTNKTTDEIGTTTKFNNNSPLKDKLVNEPRGLRNNNPGNLRLTDQTWEGEIKGTDTSFKTFSTPEAGIRGIQKSINKKVGRGLLTVEAIINAYAPPSENNTTEYVNAVAKAMKVSANEKLDLNNKDNMARMIAAIIQHENGQNPYDLPRIKGALT